MEHSIEYRLEFYDLPRAVELKRFLRDLNNLSISKDELYGKYQNTTVNLKAFQGIIDDFMSEMWLTSLDEFRKKEVRFSGNKETFFYFDISCDRTDLFLQRWLPQVRSVNNFVACYFYDGLPVVTLFDKSEAYHFDVDEPVSNYEWHVAMSEEKLPGEYHDLPYLHRQFKGNLEDALSSLSRP